jgi:phosphatidylglycerophosphatase A
MSRLFATFFYVGRLRPAPGTWGSAAAIPPAWLIDRLGGPWLLSAAALCAFLLGWWAAAREAARTGVSDAPEIVIDEVAGMWVALLPVAFGAAAAGVPAAALWPGWVAAFLLFRLFDIWKPGPIRRADRMGTPLGVMLDDLVAGGFAAFGVVVAAGLWHGLLAL